VSIVTDIRPQKRKTDRANIYLDSKFAFSLNLAVIQEAGLRVDQNLSPPEIEELARQDRSRAAFDASLHYLHHRPRSKAEVRTRLRRRKFDEEAIDNAIRRLEEQGLIDDVAFARFWRENRESFSPRSERLLKMELRGKGVHPETIDQVVEGLDDEVNAYHAGAKKARALEALDYWSFRQKLGDFLRRRGFSYDVIGPTVDRLWGERGEADDGSSP